MGVPIACLPMEAWYMLRGAWLRSGKGMSEVQRPRMAEEWISRCVYSGFLSTSRMWMATLWPSSSSLSRNSTMPLDSSAGHSAARMRCSRCSTKRGRMQHPLSVYTNMLP